MAKLGGMSTKEKEAPNPDRILTLYKHWSAIIKNAPDGEKNNLRNHQGISDIQEMVKRRSKAALEAACQAKVNPAIEKFKYPAMFPVLEKHFWNKHKGHNLWQ